MRSLAAPEATRALTQRGTTPSEFALSIEQSSQEGHKKREVASRALQIFWFFVLVGVQCTAFLLFKLVQVSGQYTFSVASSVAFTELLKLLLALFLHSRNLCSSGQTVCCRSSWTQGLTQELALKYLGLAVLYCFNN